VRLATRTGLAALAAATLSLLLIGALFRGQFSRILLDRVDAQLEERAGTAPILAAIASRLAQSELSGTVEGARVAAGSDLTTIGLLPADPLPDTIEPGWETAIADGQRWRLYTVEVLDVPRVGDQALVQLVAPLGDVEERAAELRRQAALVGLLAVAGAGLAGYLLGLVASRPITALQRDTDHLDDAQPDRWRVASSYGSPEVDGVAATLNATLGRLAEETERRGAALEAARAFASSAAHELRAPLQGALTNLNLASSDRLEPVERAGVLALATAQVQRMATALAAVRALAEAELADPSWFETVDLADVVDATVADEARRSDTSVEIEVSEPATDLPAEPSPVWPDGVRLAVGNVVRNALAHGRPATGTEPQIVIRVSGRRVTVDDNGPGIPASERQRLLERFERGSGATGSGLGLAIARQVVAAHGGSLDLTGSPLGGTRVTLHFGPDHRPGP
jgi:two-component system sensor histidine kinase PrrB